ncbi:MAG: TlyA family RNA methyltransferase [bacterium]
MANRRRLDSLLVERGLAPSRDRAQRLILAGRVTVDGAPAEKAGAAYSPEASISVQEDPCPYVSRGGLKLAGALDAFGVSPAGRFCLDAGASTGGFTDVLLRRGARRVAAVDVGRGLIDWSLRNDPRVLLMEKVNARRLTPETFAAAAGGERPGLATVDLSFISVLKVLDALGSVLAEGGEMIVLVKPQFEVGKGKVGKGGIVRDPALHREVLERVWDGCREKGLGPQGACASPITGAKGNREFFLHLRAGEESADRAACLDAAMAGEDED